MGIRISATGMAVRVVASESEAGAVAVMAGQSPHVVDADMTPGAGTAEVQQRDMVNQRPQADQPAGAVAIEAMNSTSLPALLGATSRLIACPTSGFSTSVGIRAARNVGARRCARAALLESLVLDLQIVLDQLELGARACGTRLRAQHAAAASTASAC